MDFSTLSRFFLQTYGLFLANPLFWMVVLLVALQYHRTAGTEKKIFGANKISFWQHLLLSSLTGLAGGFLASMLLVFFGISLVEIGIYYVWPLAVLLLMVNARYMCFAYAGGLVGAFSAVLQLLGHTYPTISTGPLAGIAGLHIPGLLALVGILHLTESFLIAVSGHLYPSPLYLKTEHGVVGGFTLQKFWPLPLVGLVALAVPETVAQSAAAAQMPEWWPVFASKTLPQAGQTLMYILFPIVAGLGYGDLAVSTPPRQKSKKSALNLGAYSILLLTAAFAAFRVPLLTLPAALFAPIGHEYLIIRGNRQEFAGKPLYMPPRQGVGILDIIPRSPAQAAGLLPGDAVLSVNGLYAYNNAFLLALLKHAGSVVTLEVERGDTLRHIQLEWKRGREPGIIPVPDLCTEAFVEARQISFFPALKEKLKKLLKK